MDAPRQPTIAVRPGASAWQVMLAYARPYRLALVIGGLLSLATAATGLALPLVVRELIDGLGGGRAVGGWLLLMTALVVANAAIGAVGSVVLERTGEPVVLAARRWLVTRLIRLRLSAVESTEPGDLMSRVTADTTLLREVATNSLVQAITGALTLTATVVMMGLLDLVLLGITLTVLVFAGLVIGLVVPRINRAARHAQESVGVMGAALERMFGAFRTVKASGAEQREGDRVRDAAGQAWHAGVRAAVWGAVAGNTAGLAVQASFVAVLAVGGARAATGAIDVGTVVALLLYVYYLMPPVQQLVGAVTQYQVGAAAITRIQQAEDLPVEELGESAELSLPGARPVTVTFEDVHFRYRPELPAVHHGVDFAVPAGGMTAFVGPSGAGKTTVFSLIERFYEPGSGRDWPLSGLRAAIGYVEQDAPVPSGTLRENLLFGAPHAGDHELMGSSRPRGSTGWWRPCLTAWTPRSGIAA